MKPLSKEEAVRENLRIAIYGREDCPRIWSKALAHGVTDAQVRAHLCDIFGMGGGGSGVGPGYGYNGGNMPKFWLSHWATGRKPTLQGQDLVDAVRSLLKLPYPGPNGPIAVITKEDESMTKTKTRQAQLPHMPPPTPLGLRAREYLEQKQMVADAKEELARKGEAVSEAMRKDKKDVFVFRDDGATVRFELRSKGEKLVVSKGKGVENVGKE